ncbi:S41 family peptidase [Flavobacterium piscis]|uniref:C-terminal processing protease CtpA/Prc n=1 Tax=Flavobacterium piscis TaxID=1114874 RepID=A0ABU1YAX2_9FLAO|nr:S41 family peptidase [Flavobacterium piscis]MDR7211382.1 C-terminal processing protease CtpA/Prc [Flavobacterium piscis]
MKLILRSLIFLFIAMFTLQSCEDQDDVDSPPDLKVNDFIWKGLNQYYLWQADVPNLADQRFANQESLNSFLRGYTQPEDLFEDLLNKPKSKYPNGGAIDRFSWIVDDYTVLEQELQGTSKSDGVDFRLSRVSEKSNDLVGFVRYILPNSDASSKSIKRGDLFTGINGTKLTISNYQSLLGADSYTLNMADLNGAVITPNGKSVSLTKTVLDENPVYINKVITSGSHKIGYLMYNGFYANYDLQLNTAFAQLKSEGITDLVLDLRYNGGGSVQTATYLASMITGQFKNQIFSKQKWNDKINEYFASEDLELLNNRFTDNINGTSINSLNLTKVYILTTDGTASASELVINGLIPYMSVVQIGDKTVGKNVGSITLYDSETFTKKNVNPAHKYAMQPLVLKIVNASDFGDYTDGLQPAYQQLEYVSTMDVLGEQSEPLLNLAISKITGTTAKRVQQNRGQSLPTFTDSKAMGGIRNQMYVEKAPEGLLKALK